MSGMQQMQSVFNLRMEPIQTRDHYPKYARSATKPVVRARHIIDQGAVSDHPCSVCVDLGQDCYRWEAGNFSKCAYCTSKDKKRELCHLPGREAPPGPERRKRRRMSVSFLSDGGNALIADGVYSTGNIHAPGGYAASRADTVMSGTVPSGPTSSPGVAISGARSVHATASIPDTASTVIDTRAVPPAGSEGTPGRVTALENQVSGLQEKVGELLAKLEEVGSNPTPSLPAAAGASPTTSDIGFGDLQAQYIADAPTVASAVHFNTVKWVLPNPTPSLQAAAGASPTTDNIEVGDLQAQYIADASPVASAVHFNTIKWVEDPKTPELPEALSPVFAVDESPKISPTFDFTTEHSVGFTPVNGSGAMDTGA